MHRYFADVKVEGKGAAAWRPWGGPSRQKELGEQGPALPQALQTGCIDKRKQHPGGGALIPAMSKRLVSVGLSVLICEVGMLLPFLP